MLHRSVLTSSWALVRPSLLGLSIYWLLLIRTEMVIPQVSHQAVICHCSSLQLVLILRSNLILLNIFQETDTCYLMRKTDWCKINTNKTSRNIWSTGVDPQFIIFCLVTQSCPTLFDPMDCSTPGSPVLHHLLELAQTHVHWVGDAIQPSNPLSFPSSPAFNLSQHQRLLQWINSSQQVAKVSELQHEFF